MTRPISAFSLVEVTIAIGVAAFALVAIFGLLPIGIESNQAAIQQTRAVNLAATIVEDLRHATLETGAVSPQYGIDVNSAKAQMLYLDELGTVVPKTAAAFQATLTLSYPPDRKTTGGSLSISWPVGAQNSTNAVSVFVALERK